ncbi:MAG: ABC transporter permease, partial [Rhodothermales bacterium]|nr:ABC transporter permease [Rhodothermales bacterium]
MPLRSLRLAYRTFRRERTYALLNGVGLTVGLTCALVMLLYVWGELRVDGYHANSDRIVRLTHVDEAADYGGGRTGIAKVPGPWGPAVLEAAPEVEAAVRFRLLAPRLFERGDVRAYEPAGLFADATVFDVFSFSLLRGDPATALAEPNAIVLSETTAARYFGDADPLGQPLRVEGEPLRVTGVMADVPAASHFTFDYLISLASDTSELVTQWNRTQFYTYLLLRAGTDPAAAEATIGEVLRARAPEEGGLAQTNPRLQPLRRIYLHSDLHREIGPTGDVGTVAAFGGLALLVLLVAVVNFVNLTTARSARRATEVGVRKALGAPRSALVRQ